MDKITDQVVLEIITCADCGAPFGVESNMHRNLLRNGDTFYCPSGHANYYGDNIEKRLKETKKQLEWWKNEAETKATQLKETHDSIINGKCPCCNRKFISLRKHIEKMHPEYRGG